MGTFTVQIEVGDPAGRRFVRVEALVDTGATHTLLSRDVLLALGVEPLEQVSFQLADERVMEYQVGEARIRLDGRERTTVVVFGPEGTTALLGATTLELFNMAVDPVRCRLVPVPGLLKETGVLGSGVPSPIGRRFDPCRAHHLPARRRVAKLFGVPSLMNLKLSDTCIVSGRGSGYWTA